MSNAEIGKAEIFKLTGELLKAHVANNSVPAGDLAGLISSVHQALSDAANSPPVEYFEPEAEPDASAPRPPIPAMPGLPALPPGATIQTEPEPPQEPALPIAESLTDEAIFCLECGRGFQTIARHLKAAHDLTPEQYRRKWKLPRKYPTTAKNWSLAAGERSKAGGLAAKMLAGRLAKAAAAEESEVLELTAVAAPPAPKPAVPVEDSVQPDRLICLECSKGVKVLAAHLSYNHKMKPEDYRLKWGLPGDYPMMCPNTAKFYSDRAKERGFGTVINPHSKAAGKTRIALVGGTSKGQ